MRDSARNRDDDGERSSRVRNLERELNSVLDENNVWQFCLLFHYLWKKYVCCSNCSRKIKV